MTFPKKLFAFLRALPTILGCLLFVFSFIYPLYLTVGRTLEGATSTYYWSYKVYYRAFITLPISEHFWFSGYWFGSFDRVGMPWILISLFTLQVLTVVFGSASAIFKRRILSFAPVLLSLAFMALMIYTGEILSKYVYLLVFGGEYQVGYYLVFPSVVLFVCAFALNEVAEKRQTTEPAKENQARA